MACPNPADIREWVATVHPIGPRDPSLLVFAYAAMNQSLPPTPQALDAWATPQYGWVNGTHYWDIDFLLAFQQANGRTPSTVTEFTNWLEAAGMAAKGPNGADYKTGSYPIGGTGYPPPQCNGQVAPPSSGTGGTSGSTSSTPSSPSGGTSGGSSSGFSADIDKVMSLIQNNPWEAAAVGLLAILVLKRA